MRLVKSGFGIIWIAIALIIGTALSPGATVYADAGPFPAQSMRFTFESQVQPDSIVDYHLLGCEDESCNKSEQGSEYFYCDNQGCYARYIRGTPKFRLVIEFADKTKWSNLFTKTAYNAEYVVTVTGDSLQVREVITLRSIFEDPVRQTCFLPALVATIMIELSVATIYLRIFKIPVGLKKIAGVNMLSFPVVWFVFPLLLLVQQSFILVFVLSEMFAVVFEAAILHRSSHKMGLSFRPVMILSLLMNGLSAIAGVWLSRL
jgi:hypothetical protein